MATSLRSAETPLTGLCDRLQRSSKNLQIGRPGKRHQCLLAPVRQGSRTDTPIQSLHGVYWRTADMFISGLLAEMLEVQFESRVQLWRLLGGLCSVRSRSGAVAAKRGSFRS